MELKNLRSVCFSRYFDVQNIEQVGNLKNKGKTFFTVHDMITQCQLVINMSEGRGSEREEKEKKGEKWKEKQKRRGKRKEKRKGKVM